MTRMREITHEDSLPRPESHLGAEWKRFPERAKDALRAAFAKKEKQHAAR